MKTNRLANMVQQLLLALAVMALAGGESMAQVGTMQECQGTKVGTCVEVTLRYYEQAQKGANSSSKVVILDPVTKQELKACQICDPKLDKSCKTPCPGLQGVYDASYLILLQSHKSPGCYYICSGGWCGWRCF